MKSPLKFPLVLLVLLLFQAALAQQRTVTGTVKDNSGLPLPVSASS